MNRQTNTVTALAGSGNATPVAGPLSVQLALPVRRDAALRPGHRLVQRMAVRRRECGAGLVEVVVAEVVEPVLAGLEAGDHDVAARGGVLTAVLLRRVV